MPSPTPDPDPEVHRFSFWDHASPAQWRIREAALYPRAKVCGFLGGIGSGKTAVGAALAYELAALQAPGRCAGIVTPSYTTFHQATMPEIRKWWPPEEVAWHHRKASGDEAIIVYTPHGESEIQIRSAQDSGTLQKIRGPSWAWCWGDEVGTWALWEMAYDLVIGRLRGALKGLPLRFPLFLFTGSPRWHLAEKLGIHGKLLPQAWDQGIWAQGVQPQERIYLVAARTETNRNNDPGYAEFLRATYGQAFAEQELDGDFVAPTQAVFPGFHPAIHVIPDAVAQRLFESTSRRVGAPDWGFSTGALIAMGMDPDNRVIIPPGATWAKPGTTVDERADKAREWIPRFGIRGPDGVHRVTWYVPPDDAEAVNTWLGVVKGSKAVPGTQKALNARDEGWNALRNLMRVSASVRHPCDGPEVPTERRRLASWIYIAESNKDLIRDIQTLQFPPAKPGQEIDESHVVGRAHYPDALRYAVYSALVSSQPKGHRAKERR